MKRYGKSFIPADMTIQDWGVTYAELEPYYDRFEYLCGVSGEAGNVGGTIQPGGNPFEGPRKRGYPLPPLERSFMTEKFQVAATEAGFRPFPCPAANTSKAYKNPLGVQMGKCTYCGYCEWFACGNYSKAAPQTTILPVLLAKKNFSYRTECDVTRVNLDASGKRATGVTYVDANGKEFEQPAELVVLCAFAQRRTCTCYFSRVLESLTTPLPTPGSSAGPTTPTRSPRRSMSSRMTSSIPSWVQAPLARRSTSSTATSFDHGPEGFIGGGYMALWNTGGRPIDQQTQVPRARPGWGSAWKRARAENYLTAMSIATHGSVMSFRDSYLDLDPTYRDIYGNPLLRMTFDFHDNEHRMSRFLTDKAALIAKAMKPRSSARTIARATIRSFRTRPRITPAARQWATTREPASPIATCSRGTYRTCSCSARACSRRTTATTRPARWARSRSGPPTPSAASICSRKDLWSGRERL